MITYEEHLDRDFNWALLEGSMHFEEKSSVHKALRKIARKLNELNIPYAVVGGMAMFFHGYRRFTEDVNILVTPESLKEIHRQLEGLGDLTPFPGSKHLRDTEFGVRVEFLVAGGFPGDGKPKPVAFPDPTGLTQEIEGIQFISLPKLIELKLASGITGVGRRKDLGDVQELIRVLDLPSDLDVKLSPFVRDVYRQLWQEVKDSSLPP